MAGNKTRRFSLIGFLCFSVCVCCTACTECSFGEDEQVILRHKKTIS